MSKRPQNAEATQFKKGEASETARKGGINSGKSRRKRADLRRLAQAFLDGTYTDKDGNTLTGAELFIKSMVDALCDPSGKNWGKAMELLIQLTGADKSKVEIDREKADTQLIKAKIKQLETKFEHTEIEFDNFLEALGKSAAEDWSEWEDNESEE